jgi:hypothetical protein
VGCVAITALSLHHDAHHPAAPDRPVETQAQPPQTALAPTDLTLPPATSTMNGVPIGYPQSLPGAVAAAYGYSRVATGLDVQATLRVVDTLADPAVGWFDQARRDEASAGLVAQRKKLGLPAAGPVGPAALTVTPAGYQLVGTPTPTAATVLTLNVVSMTATNAVKSTGLLVYRWTLRWNGTRWVTTTVYVNDADQRLAVTPFTPQARSVGWSVAHGG